MAEKQVNRVFTPSGPTTKAFMESEALFRGIMGPIGSGKSATCAVEVMRRSAFFPKGPDGIRRPRGVVVRNTYPDLKSTTLETWFQWVPKTYGKVSWAAPITHIVRTADMEMEVLFLALDRDDDVRKLLSLEATWIWFNEARYIPKTIIDAATGRVGRWVPYPAALNSWAGILADTNPPDTESWWYKLAERTDQDMQIQTEKLEADLRAMGALRDGQPLYEFFRQPSGLSPEAENLQNLRKGYYQMAAANKTEDYVKVYIHGEYGFVIEGKPVYPMYRDNIHCAKVKLEPAAGLPILVGADFGLTPAAVFGQRMPNGQLRWLDEVTTDRSGIKRFGQALRNFVATRYPGFVVGGAWGDPSGTAGDEDETAFDILKAETGWDWKPAPTNDWELRQEAVRGPLSRLHDGEPGLLISPTMVKVRKGFASGYHFKFVRSSNGAILHEVPAKNEYSHPHEAGQYLALGSGEYEVVHQRDPNRVRERNRIAVGTGGDPFEGDQPPPRGGRFQTQADINAWKTRRSHPGRRRLVADDTDDVVL